MRVLRSSVPRPLATLVALAVLSACGKDEGTGSGDETSTGGETSTTAAETSTTAPLTTAPMETSSSEGASVSADDTSTGEAEVTILGRLRDLPAYMPIADAEITVIDMPGLETTTDADGMCSIGRCRPARACSSTSRRPTRTSAR